MKKLLTLLERGYHKMVKEELVYEWIYSFQNLSVIHFEYLTEAEAKKWFGEIKHIKSGYFFDKRNR